MIFDLPAAPHLKHLVALILALIVYWGVGKSMRPSVLIVIGVLYLAVNHLASAIIAVVMAIGVWKVAANRFRPGFSGRHSALIFLSFLFIGMTAAYLVGAYYFVPVFGFVVYFTMATEFYFRGDLKPNQGAGKSAAAMLHFPLFVHGPIMSIENLSSRIGAAQFPQRNELISILYLFVYGGFKLQVAAKYLDVPVALVYKDYGAEYVRGPVIFHGIFAAVMQLYFIVSGYADLARGVSALFGIRIINNCRFPYFSRDPLTFFRRWNVSLARWAYRNVFARCEPAMGRRMAISVMVSFLILIYPARPGVFLWVLFWGCATSLYIFLKNRVSKRFIRNNFFGKMLATFAMMVLIFLSQALFYISKPADILGMGRAAYDGLPQFDWWAADYLVVYMLCLGLLAFDYLVYCKRDSLWLSRSNFYAQVIFYAILFVVARYLSKTAPIDYFIL